MSAYINIDSNHPETLVYGQLQQYWIDSFYKNGGDDLLYKDLNLSSSSVVVDAGVYKGEFTSKIYKQYHSNMVLIEPISEYLSAALVANENIPSHKCLSFIGALSDHTKLYEDIFIADNQSGFFNIIGKKRQVPILAYDKLLDKIEEKFNTRKIDLLKLNIEGAEFGFIESLFGSDKCKSIKSILVQFHYIDKKARELRENIVCRLCLEFGFQVKFSYPFVWEYYSK